MTTRAFRTPLCPVLLLATLFSLGCAQVSVDAPPALGITGNVHGGQQPIAGATLQLYAVGTTADGSAATPLLSSPGSTDAGGNFNLGGLFTGCPTPTSLTYLLATGGNPGLSAGTNNTAIAEIAVLGQCQTLGPGTSISLNEVSTVAALSALAPYFASPTSIGSGSSDAAALNSAFTLAQEFASSSTGRSPGNVPNGYTVPTAEINTLANVAATCVNSSGGTAGDGSPCGTLFTYATPAGHAAPTDVATALVNIFNNPASNISQIYNLPGPLAPFQPSLSSPPSSWGVVLTQFFTVTYINNGATSGSMPVDNTAYTSGATVTALGNTGALKDTGFVFAGWNTAPDGSGTAYAAGSTFVISSNITLYAQWRDWPITVWGGAQETVSLKSDGSVWTWGLNSFGQLGINTSNNQSAVPVQVLGPGAVGFLTGVQAIMGGETHNVALKSDGTVWAWGWNQLNQLGDGTTTSRTVPVQVSGLTNITSLGSRAYHTLAVRQDGTVWAWGYDRQGGLGNGVSDLNSDNPVPIQVPGINSAIMVTAGYCFSLALLQDHTLMAWGANGNGELGNGGTSDNYSPAPVQGISNVAWVSAGWKQVLAVKTDGTVWTWGSNTWTGNHAGSGLLGNGTTADSSVPGQISLPGPAVMASGGDSMSAVLLKDGTVWTFGSNLIGQLGTGSNVAQSLVPVQVPGLTNIIFITARDHHLHAIRSDGTMWSWGDGVEGELGNGQFASSSTPVQVNTF